MNLTTEQLQTLEKAVTLVDYQGLFRYYGYRLGVLEKGSWMVAKAIQAVVGGDLYYVGVTLTDTFISTFIHAIVRLGEDTFIDGRGLHTKAQLLEQWVHLQPTRCGYLELQPLFFFPTHLERDLGVVEVMINEIGYQLRLQGDVYAVERFKQMIEAQLDEAEFYRRQQEQKLRAQELQARNDRLL